MFRSAYPLAWLFHHNTGYGPHQGEMRPATAEARVAPFKEYLDVPLVALPAPLPLTLSLGQALGARLSCRQFQHQPLPLDALATLLHAGYGLHRRVPLGADELLVRPVPSGGGLYPLEVYLLVRGVGGLASGIYHYAVLPHALEQLRATPIPRGQLLDLFVGQTYAADAALIVVLTAVPGRSLCKYQDRGYRLLLLEAGHVGQNLNLVAPALGWGSVNLGGFFDGALGTLLGLDPDDEVPLYAVALGYPRAGDAATLRQW